MVVGVICGFFIVGKFVDCYGGVWIMCIFWVFMVLLMLGFVLVLSIWFLVFVIICFGLSGGGMDVVMNVWVIEVEDDIGRIWMFSFYVMWSFGFVLGVFSGLVVIFWGWSYGIYFVIVVMLVLFLVIWGMCIFWFFIL